MTDIKRSSPGRYLYEPRKRIDVIGNYDVVVAGGGPAGVAAAVAAARNGARTLVVEGTGCFGGMSTSGLVPCFCPYSYKPESLIKGLAWEILERLRAKGGVGDRTDTHVWVHIDAEKLKLVYDEMIRESKADALFFTTVSDVRVSRGRLTALVVENKNGRSALQAKTFIDATGDADVAFRAGVPCVKGDTGGRLQATSLCFVISGIDVPAYRRFYRRIGGQQGLRRLVKEARDDGRLKEARDEEFLISADPFRSKSGTLGLNFGHVYGVDGTDAAQLSVAVIKGRKLAHAFMAFARATIPGMANAEIVNTGTLLGVRETRRIRGDFVLEESAYFESRRHADDIALYDYPIDVHAPTKTTRSKGANPFRRLAQTARKVAYGIPFRVMIPSGVRNLLVAGRSVSSDRPMQGSLRPIPACFAMGEAAGTASAMAVKRRIPVVRVPPADLRARLRKQGAYLGD